MNVSKAETGHTRKLDSCALCWVQKHRCERDSSTSTCRRCNYRVTRRVNEIQVNIKAAQEFHNSALHSELYKVAKEGCLSCLALDSRSLDLQVCGEDGSLRQFSIVIYGCVDFNDRALTTSFDEVIRGGFSANVKARKGEPPLIETAALVGGYLHLLCSVKYTTEHVQTLVGSILVNNDHTRYNLEAQIMYFLVWRAEQLINELLDIIRLEDPSRPPEQLLEWGWACNAYAAAVVLYHEIDYFRMSLRHGALSQHEVSGLKTPLVNWFTEIAQELRERVQEGCGRYPGWRSTIKGSLKQLRRRGDILTLNIRLQKVKHPDPPQDPSVFGETTFVTVGNKKCVIPQMPQIDETLPEDAVAPAPRTQSKPRGLELHGETLGYRTSACRTSHLEDWKEDDRQGPSRQLASAELLDQPNPAIEKFQEDTDESSVSSDSDSCSDGSQASGSSQSSIEVTRSAVDEISLLFRNDDILGSLIPEVFQEMNVKVFEQVLYECLEVYCRELEHEARDPIESEVVLFFRRRLRDIMNNILTCCEPEDSRKVEFMALRSQPEALHRERVDRFLQTLTKKYSTHVEAPLEPLQDKNDMDSDDEIDDADSGPQNLALVRRFLISGPPWMHLRSGFQDLVTPHRGGVQADAVSSVINKTGASHQQRDQKEMLPAKDYQSHSKESVDSASLSLPMRSLAFPHPEQNTKVAVAAEQPIGKEIDNQNWENQLRPRSCDISKSLQDVAEAPHDYESSDDSSDLDGSESSYRSTYHDIQDAFVEGIHTKMLTDLISPILDPRRQAIVDRIMGEFWTIFNPQWMGNNRKCTIGPEVSPEAPNGDAKCSNASSSQISNRKRQRDDEEDKVPTDDEDERRQRPKRSTASPSQAMDKRPFACPFRKHDRRKYNIRRYRSCTLGYWMTIARVKEHLTRCHEEPIYCQRCGQEFKSKEQRNAHIEVPNSDVCELKPGHTHEGISEETMKLVRKRGKPYPGISDEGIWRHIYRLLFPRDLEVPLPYFDQDQDDVPLSPYSSSESRYEQYLRQELPRRFQAEVERRITRETGSLEESLLRSITDMIRDVQEAAFRSYRDMNEGEDLAPIQSYAPIEAMEPAPPQTPAQGTGKQQSQDQTAGSLEPMFQPLSTMIENDWEPGLLNGEQFDMESLFGQCNDDDPYNSIYGSGFQRSCCCLGPCSCLGTTISSQSQGADGINFTAPTATEKRDENVELQDWAADPTWSPLNQP